MAEENGTTSLKTKWFEISGKKTAEIITILLMVLTAALAVLYWKHGEDTNKGFEAISKSIDGQTKSNVGVAQAMRYQACLLVEETKDRKLAKADCKEQSLMP